MSLLGASIANGIRHVSLGVNAGGNPSHTLPAHKGIGLNPNSGGLNVHGSPMGAIRPPGPIKLPKPHLAPTLNHHPTLAPRPKLKPTLTPKLPATSAPAASMPTAPTGLDYTGLPDYITGSAQIGMDYGDQRQSIANQLADNARMYNTDMAQSKQDYQDAVNQGLDQESNNGLLRSGAREMTDANRFSQFNNHMSDLEAQYGSGATSRLNAALDQLSGQEALDRQKLEDNAKSEWAQVYPSNPISDPTAATDTPASAPALAAKKGPVKFSAPSGSVLKSTAPGVYHLVPIAKPAPKPLPKPVKGKKGY